MMMEQIFNNFMNLTHLTIRGWGSSSKNVNEITNDMLLLQHGTFKTFSCDI